jgi:hypothetical protein
MDPLSQWLIEHEEPLYRELVAMINRDAATANSWSSMSCRIEDNSTLLGTFTQKLTKGNESIGVYFNYNKNTSPQAAIHLTAFFNRKYVATIDALLNEVGSLRWFTIQKYGQGCNTGTMDFGKGTINVKNIRGELRNTNAPYHLHFVIKSNKQQFIDEIQDTLFKGILGEYLYLKKVGKITYELKPGVASSLLTIKELKEKLGK